ncbi:hypothetical protein CRM22_001154 [Opisthorchis felineus]|uniref:MARVEL domain-containing protein n=1 Tax=Opisthorchis felineus TaxID=147828 RepID=A0A4V3SGX5_OPIFE|nr:hypothetical protein CRM22_001154 [Opisthorchis felineus]
MKQIQHPSHLLAYGVIIALLSTGLYAAQLFFVFISENDSPWSWPKGNLPVGYLSASVMLISPVFCFAAACTRIRKWLVLAMFLAICSTAVSIALGINGLVEYMDESESQFALFTMSALNVAAGGLCGIYVILMFTDVCECHSRKKINEERPPDLHPQPVSVPSHPENISYVETNVPMDNIPPAYPYVAQNSMIPCAPSETNYLKPGTWPTAPPPYEP